MPSSYVAGSVKCAKCGALVAVNEKLQDDETINCVECGRGVGTVGEIKGIVRQAARKFALRSVRNITKR